jgi:hypothetical protein
MILCTYNNTSIVEICIQKISRVFSTILLMNLSRLTYISTPYLMLLKAKNVSTPVEFINPGNGKTLDDDPNIVAAEVE